MRTGAILALALAVLLSFTACDETVVIDDWPPGNTPKGVLELIEDTFYSRDIDDLGGCLANNFTFYFDEDDVGDGPGDYIIPESWGRDKFLEVAGKMFDEAYDIQMDINTSNVGTPDEGDTIYFARDVEVRLLVMVDATSGFLAQDYCDFEFVNDDSAGYDNWLITNWWDHTSEGISSVGSILAWFYGKP